MIKTKRKRILVIIKEIREMVGVLNITLLLTNKKLDFSQLKHNIITKINKQQGLRRQLFNFSDRMPRSNIVNS